MAPFAGPSGAVPESQGWMLCDGRELGVEAYPELYAVLGEAWGGAPGGGRFRIPDLRGRFLRGVNYTVPGEAGDPEAALRTASAPGGNAGNEVGSVQEDAVGDHLHPLAGAADATGPGAGGEWIRFHGLKVPDDAAPVVTNHAAVASPGGPETRPRNAYVNWIIRVR